MLLWLAVVLALLLSACATEVELRAARPELDTAARKTFETADAKLKAGDFQGAAALYAELAAKAKSPARERLQWRAVDALVKAGDLTAAANLAKLIDRDALAPNERERLGLFTGRIYLDAGDPARALQSLGEADPGTLDARARAEYHQLKAQAYFATGNILDGARERIAAGRFIADPAQREANDAAIFEALAALPDRELASDQPRPPDALGGWMALALIFKRQYPDPQALDEAIAQWRLQYPNHPARFGFLDEQLQSAQAAHRPPESIALLLPRSGPYAKAARAIREGFVSAYYETNPEVKPHIRFYDTRTSEAYALYGKAVAEGAQLVVGPLDKSDLRALLDGGDVPVPVLALNQLGAPRDVNDNVLQFGLNPEEEVEQVASSAWLNGFQSALILTPASAFGKRLASHFSAYWTQLGGDVATTQTYDPEANDFSGPVKQLSETHRGPAREPPSASGFGAAPATRNGGAFIFLVAYPREARLILPQLQSLQGAALPVYATSHVFGGTRDPRRDDDLAGVLFCDLPWVLESNDGDPLSMEQLTASWGQTDDVYVRLRALGIDAYNLIAQLAQLRHAPHRRYAGATGSLTVKDANRVQRQLSCARFEDGVPHLLGSAPHLQPAHAADASSAADREHSRADEPRH